MRAVLVGDDAARIDEYAAGTPWAEGCVAVGIAQGRVGRALSVFWSAISREHHDILVAHLTDARRLEEVEVAGILSLVEGRILGAFGVADDAVALRGRDEIVAHLCSWAYAVHIVLVELVGCGMAEAIEDVGTETLGIVRVFLVGDVLDKYRWVEVDERAIDACGAVGIEVDGSERSVGAVALAHHWHAAPSARVRIEPVGLLACGLVNGLDEVGSKHRVPLSVDEVGEDRAFVAPLCEVFYRCRPHADVGSAVGGVG